MLSSSVLHALEYFDDEDAKETQEFVKHFDKFFDCMNVRCTTEGRKPDLRPYCSPSDSRVDVSFILCEYCFPFLN